MHVEQPIEQQIEFISLKEATQPVQALFEHPVQDEGQSWQEPESDFRKPSAQIEQNEFESQERQLLGHLTQDVLDR